MSPFEYDYPFCSHPQCVLHVRAGDPGVRGSGHWAQLPDGRLVGRGLHDGVFLCDPCGQATLGVAVRAPIAAAA